MKMEHIAIMAHDPPAVAAWYVKHLGLTIRMASSTRPWAHFMADSGGHVMIEIYNNPLSTVPDYRAMHSLQLHLAFVSADVAADRQRLLDAGATADGDLAITAAGDTLAMLRDPWGVAIQLVQRARPMI